MKAAVVPATIGATVLTFLFIVSEIRGTTIRGDALSADAPSRAGGREVAWFSFC